MKEKTLKNTTKASLTILNYLVLRGVFRGKGLYGQSEELIRNEISHFLEELNEDYSEHGFAEEYKTIVYIELSEGSYIEDCNSIDEVEEIIKVFAYGNGSKALVTSYREELV